MVRRWFVAIVAILVVVGGSLRADEGSFDSKGVKVEYTVEGEGEPVVLIHGFAANGLLNWGLPGISKELAQSYKVITLDNRGHGKSDKPHDLNSYGMEMVDDVIRLLDHLNIRKAHAVGYSMGGLITHKLAIRYPDRLLSATVGGIGWFREDDLETKALIEQLAQSLDEGNGITPLIKRLTPVARSQPSDEELRIRNFAIMSINDAKALAAVARGFHELVVSEKELMTNRVPTQVLIGSLDPAKVGVDRMREKLPGLRVVEIPDTDHMSAFTSAEFRTALKEFLAKNKQP